MKLIELHWMIEVVAPIDGVDTNGKIYFKPEATDEQKAQAQALMDAHLGEVVP